MKTTLEDSGGTLGKTKKLRLSPVAARFADLVASGHSQTGAYRIAYKHPKMEAELAGERGWRVAQQPGVKARIEELRSESKAKTLLTLNDRLEILAEIAQAKTSKPSDKARAIEVYSKISGDQAPERHEVTGKDGGPIPMVVGQLSRREKLEAIKARRTAA